MDTKTLVVGQDVYMLSDGGHFICKGKVVEITLRGVEVETVSSLPCNNGELLHFDSNGDEYESDPYPSRMGVPFGFEYGPWHIDDMPLT